MLLRCGKAYLKKLSIGEKSGTAVLRAALLELYEDLGNTGFAIGESNDGLYMAVGKTVENIVRFPMSAQQPAPQGPQ